MAKPLECDTYAIRRSICIVFLLFFVAFETFFECSTEETNVVNFNNGGHNNDNVLLRLAASHSNSTASYNKFGFYLIGDTPYADWELKMLEVQMEALNLDVSSAKKKNLQFTVHVGDFQKVHRTECAESHYELVASTLQIGNLPTVVIPGDNDWFDCDDTAESFSFFQKHMTGMESKWKHNLPIVRSTQNPELFTMVQEGILFVSIHLINGQIGDEPAKEWDGRMNRNIQWVEQQVGKYFAAATPEEPARGIIIIGHSLRSPRTRPFFEAVAKNFVNDTERLRIPVVYLHGDGHKWDVDHKFSHQVGWRNYYDIQIDQGAFADPCIVEIAEQVDGVMTPLRREHANQVLFGKGLIRIDRQGGRYPTDYLQTFAHHLGEEAKES